jgi:hypothetical protein
MNISDEDIASGTSAREGREAGPSVTHDEQEVLEVYRRAKRMAFADIAITIQEGKRVKLWLTEKKK